MGLRLRWRKRAPSPAGEGAARDSAGGRRAAGRGGRGRRDGGGPPGSHVQLFALLAGGDRNIETNIESAIDIIIESGKGTVIGIDRKISIRVESDIAIKNERIGVRN
ncbi:hypothetical protein EVAR_42759_1 [Eumeta japonica]|uniref:Uncharacterized protein n=1 Tax=Eumeta variegata TaxID=151549 RepID=A0A4C1WJI6_EUMVA|nr:hypothetical protein EVAR_42759_1 [Eumeta japonica]